MLVVEPGSRSVREPRSRSSGEEEAAESSSGASVGSSPRGASVGSSPRLPTEIDLQSLLANALHVFTVGEKSFYRQILDFRDNNMTRASFRNQGLYNTYINRGQVSSEGPLVLSSANRSTADFVNGCGLLRDSRGNPVNLPILTEELFNHQFEVVQELLNNSNASVKSCKKLANEELRFHHFGEATEESEAKISATKSIKSIPKIPHIIRLRWKKQLKMDLKKKSKPKMSMNKTSARGGSKRKRKAKRDGGCKEAPPVVKNTPEVASNSYNVVAKWVQRALDLGVDSLRAEYRGIATYTSPDMTVAAFKTNDEAGRNRYYDVPCQDQFRVVLNWPGAPCDYVHANYVATALGSKRFICTQGPLDVTVNDFWMMVLQENSETIVMLCNCIEMGKYKCAQYWPNTVGEVRNIGVGGIEITHKKSHPISAEEHTVIQTNLSVKFDKPGGGQETREIRHYQWTDWPDRGVPPCKLTSMELLSRVRVTKKPIVVHCSAGIGRTGTIVAIEKVLEIMQAGQECATMGELLKELRNQRAYTIQNDVQYLFVHRVLLMYFLEKHEAHYEAILTAENQAKYKKFVEEYNTAAGQK